MTSGYSFFCSNKIVLFPFFLPRKSFHRVTPWFIWGSCCSLFTLEIEFGFTQQRGKIIRTTQRQSGRMIWNSEPHFFYFSWHAFTSGASKTEQALLSAFDLELQSTMKHEEPHLSFFNSSYRTIQLLFFWFGWVGGNLILQPHHCVTPGWSLAPTNGTLWFQFYIVHGKIAETYGDATFLHACNVISVRLFSEEQWVKLNNMTGSCSISWGIYMIPWMTAKLVTKTLHGCCNVGRALFQWPREKERSHTRVKLWPE